MDARAGAVAGQMESSLRERMLPPGGEERLPGMPLRAIEMDDLDQAGVRGGDKGACEGYGDEQSNKERRLQRESGALAEERNGGGGHSGNITDLVQCKHFVGLRVDAPDKTHP